MKLYHGSNIVVQKPVILENQRLLDFGKGFYVTTNVNQAERWALIKQRRSGGETKAIVTVYEIDNNLLDCSSFVVRHFPFANEEWLDFIVSNRSKDLKHPYDIVKGAVANDTLYATLVLFETGLLSKVETISRLKSHKLFDQISFHNQQVLTELRFVEAYELK